MLSCLISQNVHAVCRTLTPEVYLAIKHAGLLWDEGILLVSDRVDVSGCMANYLLNSFKAQTRIQDLMAGAAELSVQRQL